MDKVRLGLIGCGGRMGAHMNCFEQMDNVEIVAVCDPIPERREAAAKRFGAKRMYADHNELFANEDKTTLDALYIAVEPTAHVNLEEQAIDKGIPFLVEKPMALDVEQARNIAKRVEETGLITAVGFQDRYLDLIEMVK